MGEFYQIQCFPWCEDTECIIGHRQCPSRHGDIPTYRSYVHRVRFLVYAESHYKEMMGFLQKVSEEGSVLFIFNVSNGCKSYKSPKDIRHLSELETTNKL